MTTMYTPKTRIVSPSPVALVSNIETQNIQFREMIRRSIVKFHSSSPLAELGMAVIYMRGMQNLSPKGVGVRYAC